VPVGTQWKTLRVTKALTIDLMDGFEREIMHFKATYSCGNGY